MHAQSCLTLCDSIDCSLLGSSVLGVSPARILEWVAISSSRGSSRPRDQICVSRVSCIVGRHYHLSHQGSPKKMSYHHSIDEQRCFPGGSVGETPPANTGDRGSIPGLEDPLEKKVATHSSIFAWRILWTEEPSRLQSMGSQRVSQTQLSDFTFFFLSVK